MLIFVCDICGKKITKEKEGFFCVEKGNDYKNFSFCGNCSKPIAAFLKKRGLIKPETPKGGKLKKKVGLH